MAMIAPATLVGAVAVAGEVVATGHRCGAGYPRIKSHGHLLPWEGGSLARAHRGSGASRYGHASSSRATVECVSRYDNITVITQPAIGASSQARRWQLA